MTHARISTGPLRAHFCTPTDGSNLDGFVHGMLGDDTKVGQFLSELEALMERRHVSRVDVSFTRWPNDGLMSVNRLDSDGASVAQPKTETVAAEVGTPKNEG